MYSILRNLSWELTIFINSLHKLRTEIANHRGSFPTMRRGVQHELWKKRWCTNYGTYVSAIRLRIQRRLLSVFPPTVEDSRYPFDMGFHFEEAGIHRYSSTNLRVLFKLALIFYTSPLDGDRGTSRKRWGYSRRWKTAANWVHRVTGSHFKIKPDISCPWCAH